MLDVSVVMPAAGVDQYLGSQLESLEAQDFEGSWELVIALNSDLKKDLENLNALVAKFELNSTIIVASELKSAAYARNQGVASATAEIIAFCDSDDICEPDWLRVLTQGLTPDSKFVVGGHLAETQLGVSGQEHWRPPATPDALPTYLDVPYLVSANMAMSVKAFNDAGTLDETLTRCEDIALSWKLIDAGYELRYVGDAVVQYRHRKGLKKLLHQHYLYGLGFHELLSTYSIPGQSAQKSGSLANKLRSNNARVEHRSIIHYSRRGAIATGRLVGLLKGLRNKPGKG